MITKLTSDKAAYLPGDQAKFKLSIISEKNKATNGKYCIEINHLENKIDLLQGEWFLEDGDTDLELTWQTPQDDFKGYMVKVMIYDSKSRELDQITSAVDVSSSWTKFPRYGFLTDFTSCVDTKIVIQQMKDWQLNGIEYYDWKFLHHQLLPADGRMIWQDWAGREIDGLTVKGYIKEAKKKNIINMSYNMVYAATNNFADYGVKDEWGLWYAEDHGQKSQKVGDRFTFHMGSSPSGQSDLYFFDIENVNWQDYIITKNKQAIQTMGFDGWHGDTVGEWGRMWTYPEIDTEAVGKYVKDGYTTFLNKAKDELGDLYLSFNPVGAQGIENVNRSKVDVLYAEIWPWDSDSEGNQYDTYMSLKREIDQSRRESGGKSLIIPAYMEYDHAQASINNEFNMAAVLLTDAAVYAAGGSRLELGDGRGMLSNEYFPKQNLFMGEEHVKRQHDLQNFIVAYENLLRDGLEDNGKTIEIENNLVSNDGQANTVWAYSKASDKYETIQLINLTGVTTNDWRANEGRKEIPIKLEKLKLKYYTDSDFVSAWITSPDPDFRSISKELVMKKVTDDRGNYVLLEISSLEYWDMVYFKK